MTLSRSCLIVALVMTSFGHPAWAGIIVDVADIYAPDGDVEFYAPGETAPNQNRGVPLADRFHPVYGDSVTNVPGALLLFRSPDPIEIVLRVEPSGGTTEYLFNESLLNGTGQAWGGYHVELGFGTGDGFIPARQPGLVFDAGDPSPVSLTVDDFRANRFNRPLFGDVARAGSSLSWTQGSVAPGAQSPGDIERFTIMLFSVDLPDLAHVPAWARDGDGYLLTLRQYPACFDVASER